MKALVIEDDTYVRKYICHVLKGLDFDTLEAENGEVGIDVFSKVSPDLIITDINMPGKNGFQAIAEIRAVNSQVKIIAISGGGFTDKVDNLQQAASLGADWVLKKPFYPSDIENIIKKI